MQCPECSKENSEDSKFCNECGSALIAKDQTLPNVPVYEAERKRVTALFADLSGYTAMTAKLGPEEVKQIMNIIFNDMGKIIHKMRDTKKAMFEEMDLVWDLNALGKVSMIN